jgi:Nucleolar protein,Nop52
MADKVPVQDELAKHIAKLMWCLVGPPIEDDMAGQAYLDMEMEEQLASEQAMLEEEEEENDEGSEDNGCDKEEHSDGHSAENIMDDDDDDKMEAEGDKEDDEIEDDFDQENHKHIRGAPLAQLMIRTFFRTLVREWGKLDKYRVDKFYTMLRYILHEVYKYMAKRQWNLGIIKLFNDAIAEEALIKRPNGVRYHLIDIALEELVVVVKSSKKNSYLPLTEAIFLEVMEPFFAMAQHGFGDRTVQARVVEKILEKFLNEYSLVSDVAAAGNNDKILDQVHVGTVSNFIFEMASDDGTVDTCRKSLYDTHKSYERQRKKTGTDLELNFEKEVGEAASGDGDDEAEDADYSEEQDLDADEDDDLKYLGFVDEGAEEEEEEESPSKSTQPEVEGKKAKKNKKKAKKEKKLLDSKEGVKGNGQVLLENQVKNRPGEQARKGNLKPKGQMDITQHNGDDKQQKQPKMDKKKKHEEEEVLTISMSDQKKAKHAFKKQNEMVANTRDDDKNKEANETPKRPKKNVKSATEGKGEKKKKLKRRVSFDNHNQARSWTASMNGLRTFDPTEVASKTPEKSILLNKGKKSPINKSTSKRGRKRAVDYF